MNPKATRDHRVTIFRAISRLTVLGDPLDAYVRSEEQGPITLAVALGISNFVARRDEEATVKRLDRSGFQTSKIAPRIGRSDRTVRRRKHRDIAYSGWNSDDDLRAAVVFATKTREYAYGGDWDIKSRVLLFDAARWFALKKRPISFELWWAIACALGLASGTMDGTGGQRGRFTNDAVLALWCVPQPAKLAAAACLVVQDEMLGEPRRSNRELAKELGLLPSVVDRFVKTDTFKQHVAAHRLYACQNVRHATDPSRLVNIAGKLVPASSVRKSVRFPTLPD
ncbi:hypothetical protein [Neoaquamicrobium microcysteis]|uniref:hypothetical protein n=1 Tax=Neoaquamicrobium microcysteis TaxID=2682781 RepID=UPI0013763C47|nr:hypothetical protein [Mesorhizobium microcysteis]